MAAALKEDHSAVCEELSRVLAVKSLQENAKQSTSVLVAGPLILDDNARLHSVDVVTKKLRDYGWEVLPHALYSPDMSLPDFYLFPKLKEPMRGRHFFLLWKSFIPTLPKLFDT